MSNVIFWVWVQDKLAKPVVTRWTSPDVLGAFRGVVRSRGGPNDGGSLSRAVRQLADAYSDLYRRG